MRGLLDFVIHVREASIPGVMMSHLDISQEEEQTTLTFELTIYASPYASGEVFADLPAASLPPTPMLATPSPTPETTLVDETVVTTTPAPALPNCPNAPDTFFVVGDTAVVDFNGSGALRILSDVGPAIDVLAQAYDNQVLRLLDGPVCGQWREQNTWYWYVDDLDGTLGWVAEGPAGDRWLCPMSNPECA